ncbi:hypothetical protein GQ55_6G255100 [Panicum hallii var. hallii]|uniref:Uncharacterized protein n=1 Tax=Panicum hallii var. hallii TaxID=1504633 RepID=A0A2T7D9H5_9POAL|nr:hypothetical protein GQ55_6G255100 [Panicum hallii var. hallii]
MKPRGGRGGGGEQPAVRKGPWTAEEDEVLLRHVREHGPREWSSIRSKGLLPRTGKSCRLRWVNKLRPDLKTGCKFSAEEERVVIDLQAQLGNKWARIATYLPGRTDNDVKNFWSTRQKRLARLLRAAVPRRRPGKQSGSVSSSHAYELPTQKDPCLDMIPFQGTTTPAHHTGESSSHEPRAANQHRAADAPSLGAHSLTPPPVPLLTHGGAGAGHGSSSAAPTSTALLPFDGDYYARDAVASVDPLVFVDPAACPEPLAVVPPGTFFGLDDDYVHAGRVLHPDASGVRFDDLPPETFDFFELPHLPPSPSPTVGSLS